MEIHFCRAGQRGRAIGDLIRLEQAAIEVVGPRQGVGCLAFGQRHGDRSIDGHRAAGLVDLAGTIPYGHGTSIVRKLVGNSERVSRERGTIGHHQGATAARTSLAVAARIKNNHVSEDGLRGTLHCRVVVADVGDSHVQGLPAAVHGAVALNNEAGRTLVVTHFQCAVHIQRAGTADDDRPKGAVVSEVDARGGRERAVHDSQCPTVLDSVNQAIDGH